MHSSSIHVLVPLSCVSHSSPLMATAMHAVMQRLCQKGRRECFICPCHLGVHIRTHSVIDQRATSVWIVCDFPASLILYCRLTQFLCWSHSVMRASAWWKIQRKCFIFSIPAWCKLHHVPCVLQSTWCAASVPCMPATSRASLVPRPYACVRKRIWLNKSKSLGLLQNLKASNEITKRHFIEIML